MTTRLSGRDLALALACVAIWGYTFVLIKVALGDVPPFALAALRFLFAAVPVCVFVRPPDMRAGAVIAYGLAIGVFQFGLLFLGIRLGMPAGLSSLVIQMQVFFTIGLAVALSGERLHRYNVLGAVLATVGVALLGAYKLAAGAAGTFAGFAAVIAAAVAWAAGNVIAARATAPARPGTASDGSAATGARAPKQPDMLALVVWSSLVPPLPLAALSYALEGGSAAWEAVRGMSLTTLACILFMAYAATLFCYGTWNRLLQRYPTALISPFALLVPVSGMGSGALFLGETLTPVQFVGALLVLGGLLMNVYGPRLARAAP